MIDYKTYKHLEHELTRSSGKMENLPEEILFTLKEWEVEYSDKVIVAYDADLLVGFFRYDLGDKRPWLYAAGTYVIPEYRNKNIAFHLWDRAIISEHPNKILAHIASDGGLRLIQRIKNKYSRIIFDISLDKKMLVA